MGKKKGAANPHTTTEEQEGFNLLGSPTFQPLENGRLKCVETGHELPAHSRDSYALSKHCRLGLIDSAVAGNKPPLNLFRQDPVARSKIICKLTGVTINKLEEHINGKRFLSLLEKKEAEKEMQNGAKGNCDEEKEEEKNEDDAGAEEANYEAGELSKRTKQMSLEIGPSSFASRKKIKKLDAKSLII